MGNKTKQILESLAKWMRDNDIERICYDDEFNTVCINSKGVKVTFEVMCNTDWTHAKYEVQGIEYTEELAGMQIDLCPTIEES